MTTILELTLTALEIGRQSNRDARDCFDDAHTLLTHAANFIAEKERRPTATERALAAKGFKSLEEIESSRRVGIPEGMQIAGYKDRESFLSQLKRFGKSPDELTRGDAVEIGSQSKADKSARAKLAGRKSAEKRASLKRRKKRIEKV